jgi:hypothetical protein
MIFKNDDIVKVIMRLGLSKNDFDMVSKKLDVISVSSLALCEKVLNDIERLDELEKSLTETAGSQNYAIIKADVLQYGEKQKTYGILSEMLRISQRLSLLLDIKGDFSQLNEQLSLSGATPLFSGVIGRTSRS